MSRAHPEYDSYLPLLYACARSANAAEGVVEAVREIIRLVLARTGWDAGRACLCLQSAVTRYLVVSVGGSKLPPALGREGLSVVGAEEAGLAALETGRVTTGRSQAGMALVGVPILRRGSCPIGVMEFYSSQPVELDPELKETLTEIADQLSRVIGRYWNQRAAMRQQAELALESRIASMRELARNLAHEVNQPLAAVVAYAGGVLQLLEQGRADEAKMRRALEQVGAQAKRASGIIQEFRQHLRRQDDPLVKVNVTDLVSRVMELHGDLAREAGIEVEIAVADDLPQIAGMETELLQMLSNLVLNAIEAMSGANVKRRELRIEASVDEQLEIRIRDTGVGMPQELLPDLFMPFYTNKAHGLGMGLPVTRSIAENHGGRLCGDNNPDGGMTFRIRLPLARDNADRT